MPGEDHYKYFDSPWTSLVKTSTMFVGKKSFSKPYQLFPQLCLVFNKNKTYTFKSLYASLVKSFNLKHMMVYCIVTNQTYLLLADKRYSAQIIHLVNKQCNHRLKLNFGLVLPRSFFSFWIFVLNGFLLLYDFMYSMKDSWEFKLNKTNK